MLLQRRLTGRYTSGQADKMTRGSLHVLGIVYFLVFDENIISPFSYREEHYDPTDQDAMKFLGSKEFQAVEAGFRNYLSSKYNGKNL